MGLYMYAVKQDLVAGLPQEPYIDGVGKFKRVILHDTACDGDSAPAERAYFGKNWNIVEAFPLEFIDHNIVIQIADPRYKQWASGHTGNEDSVNLELCHDNTKTGFLAALDRWCERAALYLFAAGVGVKDGDSLMSHKEVSNKWHETDHQDPDSYLARFGIGWGYVVQRVANYYLILESDARKGVITAFPAIPKECIVNPLCLPKPPAPKVHWQVVTGWFVGDDKSCLDADTAAKKIQDTFNWHSWVEKSPN